MKGLLVKTSILAVALFATGSVNTGVGALESDTGRVFHANSENPGAAIDLPTVLSKHVDTLLFIHSPHCGPCKRVAPKIKKLAGLKSDVKIVEMTLDSRKDPNGIGWDSPAAKQFDIHAVPAFMLFNPEGKLLAKGEIAKAKVNSWLIETGIEKE